MSLDIFFKVAVLENAALLHDLHVKSFPEDERSGWSEENFASTISSDVSNIIVAYLGEVPTGFIAYSNIESEAEILSIGVLPTYRGQKVAQSLLEEFLRIATPKQIFLEVAENNKPAIEFYLKNGFSLVTTRKNYYRNGVDAIVIRLVIPEVRES